MLYFILLIIILTIILYVLYKDFVKVIKITSIITISSGFLTFVVGYLIKYFLNTNLNFINISKITDILMFEFVLNGISLLLLGLFEFICYFIFNYVYVKKKVINS